ncbi:hypothetical protein [Streptomyces sp. NPDC021356]|uniref:hypothetical protein n=1 Tax=Streptomyces sp. NPDC021356 TaxID=3154900 RepID=UPI0033C5FC8B
MTATASGGGVVRLHRLTMIDEDDGVMVGRPDTASYALFPPEGAEALRMLDSGATVAAVAEWYRHTCEETLDVDDFLGTLDELGFLRAEGEPEPTRPRVRWRRLGRWTFSGPAWLCYVALLVAAVVAMARDDSLRPSYHQVFFTDHLALIPLTMTAVQIPCILVHEAFHALAGRRLGLPSTLRISRRLYFIVAETRLDSLLSVPRRRRYLPFLAGMLADVLIICAMTLLAPALRGTALPAWCPALCLATAFSCVLRLLWQLMFYLQTDLYFVMANALRCSDLHNATRSYLRTLLRRLLRRPVAEPDEQWTDRDRAMARVYAPFLVAGYGFSLGSLLWAALPATVHFGTLLVDRFRGGASTSGVVDAVSFLGLTALQFGLLGYIAVRDRRAGRTSPQGALG